MLDSLRCRYIRGKTFLFLNMLEFFSGKQQVALHLQLNQSRVYGWNIQRRLVGSSSVTVMDFLHARNGKSVHQYALWPIFPKHKFWIWHQLHSVRIRSSREEYLSYSLITVLYCTVYILYNALVRVSSQIDHSLPLTLALISILFFFTFNLKHIKKLWYNLTAFCGKLRGRKGNISTIKLPCLQPT